MPAAQLDVTTGSSVGPCDLLGHHVSDSSGFVLHVALSAESHANLKWNDSIKVRHMSPPLRTSSMAAHAWGTVKLSADDIQKIQFFIRELEGEYSRSETKAEFQYCVRPHMISHPEKDGTVVRKRFSCAGFVVEAYREAKINLVSTDDSELPNVTLETLLQAYQDKKAQRCLREPRLRAKSLNLIGDGPWPVLLPGHVLNAAVRDAQSIKGTPYVAVDGDEFFPTRSG